MVLPSSFSTLGNNFFPTMLDRYQEIFDQDDILFLGEILQMSSLFVQAEHGFSLRRNLILEFLMLLNLSHDRFKDSGNGFQISQCLFSIGQPVDKGLKSFMELGSLLESNFQFDFLVIGTGQDVVPSGFQSAQVVLQIGSSAIFGLFQVLATSAE